MTALPARSSDMADAPALRVLGFFVGARSSRPSHSQGIGHAAPHRWRPGRIAWAIAGEAVAAAALGLRLCEEMLCACSSIGCVLPVTMVIRDCTEFGPASVKAR